MDFTLTPEQELLRSTARALLSRECPPSLVRAHMDDPTAADELWKHLREWVGLAGGPLVDLCLFLEETGAVLAPGPFFCTTALFAPMLAAVDHELLPRVTAGDVTGTVAMANHRGRWVAHADVVKTFVLEADRVDYIAAVLPGPAVVLLLERPRLRQVGTLDSSRRVFEVEVDDAGEDALALSEEQRQDVLQRATVALAAEMVGTTRRLLEMTLAYAKVREQFDRPIGSFQAVQHKLADMALAQERAWSAVYYAAMAIDAGDPDRQRAAHVAKAAAGDAVRRCAKDGIQIHGGVGYTWEHDLHLSIRRAYASEHFLGTTDWHHDRLGALLLGD